MDHLTYDEYTTFSFTEMEIDEFNKIVGKASDAIDSVTRRFYVFTDIETDVAWRREAFKKAVAAQIEYFYETGSTTSNGLNEPEQITIGRTSLGGRQGAASRTSKPLVSNDALMHLQGTGLLYRGVF